MNSGQMFLAVGAMVILTLLTMTINNSVLNSSSVSAESEYTITGNGVLQGLVEEIRSKPFDVVLVSNPDAGVQDFTAPGGLGPMYGETYPNFNDLDDFNNQTITISTPRVGDYTARCTVAYVNPDAPETAVGYRTHSKRVSVTMTNPFMKDTLRAMYVASY